MEKDTPVWTLAELAEILGGTISGHPNHIVRRPVPADSDDPDGIAFCESEPYLEKAHAHGVGALILPHSMFSNLKPSLHVEHPRLAFGRLLAMSSRPLPIASGIHPTAVVDPTAEIDPSASIGAYAVVERGAEIRANAKVFPFAYVGDNCVVGDSAILYPHAVLYQDVKVGARTIIHSGVVLGADGFGFMWDGKKQFKVPQVGQVTIGDDCEIGANTTIDRATAGATSIGRGTKLDNLIQIGHNVKIGEDGVFASQTGISGSTTLGDRIVMGGQCAIGDHITITDDVTMGGHSGTSQDILEKGAYFGMPAKPAAEGLKSFLMVPKLPEIFSRLRALEKRVAEMEKEGE